MRMELLDLVHHNPGEEPFVTRYLEGKFLRGLGYTGQVLKHLNACVELGEFPATAEERRWLEGARAAREREIAEARGAGLEVFYHVDLVVLPKAVVEARKGELCDEKGRVDFRREAVKELHRELIARMFEGFPEVAGLVVRVGETYLFDTPHHAGNTAVPMHDEGVGREEMMARFRELVGFLREEVCVRHGKRLIYRTWDYFGDRFHADAGFYRAVTDAVEPHELLVFSIKHTAGDFFRGCRANPCLGQGRHGQIAEVQCAREYEGKGAFPNYIARGVIEGFEEVPERRGLRDWARSGLLRGVWTWSRGGGWFGPYLRHEFWPDLNARVLAAWTREGGGEEGEIFERVAREEVGFVGQGSVAALREMCLASERGVWLGRSVPVFARLRGFVDVDCGWLWMRDDRLGGLEQLGEMFGLLEEAGLLDEAVEEKREAAAIFAGMRCEAGRLKHRDGAVVDAVRTSVEYGARLFELVARGWELLVKRWRTERGGGRWAGLSEEERRSFGELVRGYRAVAELPQAASLYELDYWNWPGQPPKPGMAVSLGWQEGGWV